MLDLLKFDLLMHFNSTIVRLKLSNVCELYFSSHKFQFYNSPIKTHLKKLINFQNYNFNSTIVRLKPKYIEIDFKSKKISILQ